MAVGPREERQRARWLNVKRGDLVDHNTGESLGWASGVVEGIRIARSEKFGNLELHLRMVDENADPDWRTVIIAGTLTVPGETFSIWSRMLVGRLVNQNNQLDIDDRLLLEFYPIETDYGDASCVAVYRDGTDIRLEGVKISSENKELMVKCLRWLEERYPWGRGATLPPAEEQLLALVRGEDAPSEPASRVVEAIEQRAEDAEVVPESTPEPEPNEDAPSGRARVQYRNEETRVLFEGKKPSSTAAPDVAAALARVEAAARDETQDGDGLPF